MMPSVVPMIPAKMTAVMPTTIDTRAPKISRDSTSRPSWSVPSRYSVLPPFSQNGGLNRAVRVPTSGLCGASRLAKIAISAIAARIATGISGKSPSRNRRSAAKRGGGGAKAYDICRGAHGSALQSDARIDDRVEDIDHQVDDERSSRRP